MQEDGDEELLMLTCAGDCGNGSVFVPENGPTTLTCHRCGSDWEWGCFWNGSDDGSYDDDYSDGDDCDYDESTCCCCEDTYDGLDPIS